MCADLQKIGRTGQSFDGNETCYLWMIRWSSYFNCHSFSGEFPAMFDDRKDGFGGFFGCLRWPDYGGFYVFLLISIQTFYWWIYDDIYYIILCYIMLCYIILCYVMLCYVILYYIIWYCMVLYGHVIYKYICIILFYGLWVFFFKNDHFICASQCLHFCRLGLLPWFLWWRLGPRFRQLPTVWVHLENVYTNVTTSNWKHASASIVMKIDM